MSKPTAMLFPFTAIVLWAGNVIVSKLSASTIHPSAITFYRLLLAVSLMSFFLLIPTWRNRRTIFQHWVKLAFLGFLSMALYQSLSYLAAESTTATNMAIVTALTPLLTMLLSVIMLRDAPTKGMLLGGVLSLLGLAYLLSHGHPFKIFSLGIHLGDGLMLGAAFSYALYSVLLRRWNLPIKGWQSTYIQASSALICMVPLLFFVPSGLAEINRETLPLIAYAGVLASIVLPFCWIEGIKLIGPNRCSMFMNMLPILTAAIAIILLDEKIYAYHIIGGGITLLGILLAQIWAKSFNKTINGQN